MAAIHKNWYRSEWGSRSIGGVRYCLAAVCVAAQAATVAITWPLWQVRDAPPNLPLVDLPQIAFGWPVIVSLIVVLVCPRIGLRVHLATLLISFVFDEWRMQPQVIGVAVMMIAAIERGAAELGRWYLIAMWLWSGLHKLLSPDWMGWVSWGLLDSGGLSANAWHKPFAYSVAFGEIVLAIAAIVRPRWAAFGCMLMHSVIAALFSPWLLNQNVSIVPWNLCTAIVDSA